MIMAGHRDHTMPFFVSGGRREGDFLCAHQTIVEVQVVADYFANKFTDTYCHDGQSRARPEPTTMLQSLSGVHVQLTGAANCISLPLGNPFEEKGDA